MDGLALWREGPIKAGFPDGQSGFVVLQLWSAWARYAVLRFGERFLMIVALGGMWLGWIASTMCIRPLS
jgi:hypothetical protein